MTPVNLVHEYQVFLQTLYASCNYALSDQGYHLHYGTVGSEMHFQLFKLTVS